MVSHLSPSAGYPLCATLIPLHQTLCARCDLAVAEITPRGRSLSSWTILYSDYSVVVVNSFLGGLLDRPVGAEQYISIGFTGFGTLHVGISPF